MPLACTICEFVAVQFVTSRRNKEARAKHSLKWHYTQDRIPRLFSTKMQRRAALLLGDAKCQFAANIQTYIVSHANELSGGATTEVYQLPKLWVRRAKCATGKIMHKSAVSVQTALTISPIGRAFATLQALRSCNAPSSSVECALHNSVVLEQLEMVTAERRRHDGEATASNSLECGKNSEKLQKN